MELRKLLSHLTTARDIVEIWKKGVTGRKELGMRMHTYAFQ
jgi:hypothetical protein